MGNYLVVGNIINNRFRLDSILGRGGQGEVFAAHDLDLDRPVAIKVMLREDSDSALSMLLKEAKAAARLDHPNIVRIYDWGRSGDQAYIVMERLDGGSLAELERHTQLPVATLVDYAVSIAEALAYAHAQGVIHRDIKPGNIFVTSTGGVKLIDFGIAHLHGETTSLIVQKGTPYFWAPEVQLNQRATTAVDIFSLGRTLEYCIEGQLQETAPDLVHTISRMTAARPGDRPSATWVVEQFARIRTALKLGLDNASATSKKAARGRQLTRTKSMPSSINEPSIPVAGSHPRRGESPVVARRAEWTRWAQSWIQFAENREKEWREAVEFDRRNLGRSIRTRLDDTYPLSWAERLWDWPFTLALLPALMFGLDFLLGRLFNIRPEYWNQRWWIFTNFQWGVGMSVAGILFVIFGVVVNVLGLAIRRFGHRGAEWDYWCRDGSVGKSPIREWVKCLSSRNDLHAPLPVDPRVFAVGWEFGELCDFVPGATSTLALLESYREEDKEINWSRFPGSGPASAENESNRPSYRWPAPGSRS